MAVSFWDEGAAEMIIDENIERAGATYEWSEAINVVKPDSFIPQLAADGLHTYIAGPAYAGALGKVSLGPERILPNTGKVTLVLAICPDHSLIERGQAIEHDLRITIGGLTYLFDMQNNLAKGGMLQIGTGSAWLDANVKLGIPASDQWTTYRYAWAMDTNAKVSEPISAQVDGAPAMMVPVGAQPAQSLGWGDGVVFQNQRCLNEKGGAMSDVVNVSLEWE